MHVNALATERHYIDHVAPIYNALPDEMRGAFYTSPKLTSHAINRGIRHPRQWLGTRYDAPMLVGSYSDAKKAKDQGQLIFVEHGIGQTYSNRSQHGSYAGGLGHERVGLFLCPSQRVSDLWLQSYPNAKVAVVGEPRLDPWHSVPKISVSCSAMPTVALSFHWNADSVAPEAMWAFPHYRRQLKEYAAQFHILGHGHPRAMGSLIPWYKQAGIEIVKDFHEILDRADVYVCDNSSTLYEFASTRRPVVVLNAPWYRRNVEHGVRFWEYADVGPQVDGPGQLVEAIWQAWVDHPDQAARREVVADALVAYRDGTASAVASHAIQNWLRSRERVAA